MRAAACAAAACLCLAPAWCAKQYEVTGILLKVDRPNKSFVASCAAIPGYMAAMAMPYSVREEKALDGVQPGMQIDFTLVVDGGRSYAESLREHRFQSVTDEAFRARRLALLDPNAGVSPLKLGQPIADFTLTDQTRKRISLSQFAGKVVAITFLYTSCPLPDYCFRMSNNFGQLNRRFAAKMGRDLILLSVSFDPGTDTPEVLAKYSKTWKADANTWHFLTGSLTEVKAVCAEFGLNFWQDEGLLTHSLRTVVIDRQGRLAGDLDGNEFSAEQLGDLVQATLERR
ncbi:MAG TPA: SCO family protein [Bryobacteraceae bacterium]|nr:SCO family protein [Bryobacteraceae bacterium]